MHKERERANRDTGKSCLKFRRSAALSNRAARATSLACKTKHPGKPLQDEEQSAQDRARANRTHFSFGNPLSQSFLNRRQKRPRLPTGRMSGIKKRLQRVEIVFKDGIGYDSRKLLESVRGQYGRYLAHSFPGTRGKRGRDRTYFRSFSI
jgi:hypothetical protein